MREELHGELVEKHAEEWRCPLHCAVAMTENGVRLYDLDSMNGTYIDDERIQVADLQDLSVFRIGLTEFVVSVVPNGIETL